MSETGIENENKIVTHFQEALQRVGIAEELKSELGVEYACLRSMMLEPQNTTMWNALALVYMMSDRIVEAEEAIERSLDIDTSNAWTWALWGDLLLREDRLVDAERVFRMAVELNPMNVQAIRNLAVLYAERGAHTEAIDLFQILLQFEPNDQDIWDAYSTCLGKMRK